MNNPGAPFKVLCCLTAAVAVAHLVVLHGTSNALQATDKAASRPFSTRSISLAPPTPMPAVVAAAAPSAVATPQRATPPRPPKAAAPVAKPRGPVESGNGPPSVTSIGPSDSMPDRPALEPTTTAVPEETTVATAPTVALAASAPASAASAPADNPQAAATTVPTVSTAPTAPEQTPAAAAPEPTAPALAYTLPGSTRLKYNVVAYTKGLNFDARAEFLWRQDGNSYEARLEASAFLLGSRIQTSSGRVNSAGLEPSRFSNKVRSEEAAHFERDKRLVTFSANTPQVPLLAGMQDQLSAIVQLSSMIAGAPGKFPAGTVITLETVSHRSADTWVLTVGDEEKLSLPGGELMALKVTRQPRGTYDQTAELWLAPGLGYLPARIKLTEKSGDFLDQTWRATDAP